MKINMKEVRSMKLEEILREIVTLPEPRRFLEMTIYIKHLGEVRDNSHYYRTCAKRLFKKIYCQEYKEKGGE